MNKKLLRLLPAALLCLALTCCDNEEYDPLKGVDTTANVNANTDATNPVAQLPEMPRVNAGAAQWLLITKEDPGIGLNYTVQWDCNRRAQTWVAFAWTQTNSSKGWNRDSWSNTTWQGKHWSADPFQADPAVPEDCRTELSDYKGSGYDRGHMCASEDRICSQNVNGQTFYLTNMQPQVNAFNAGVWQKMESQLRTWRDNVIAAGGEMYVCKGGTIDKVNIDGVWQTAVLAANPVTGKTNEKLRMPVPKYFFMAVMVKNPGGTYYGMAFWAEHKADKSTNLKPYMISIDKLEELTGYDFFCNLPDYIEEPAEKTLNTSLW